jgi:ATP-binding cassette subfamily C protein/ATP-binding cassette subfamily C protein EexD
LPLVCQVPNADSEDLIRMQQPTDRDDLKAALRGSLPYFGAAALFSCGINLLYLASPIYMLQVYDRVMSSGSHYTLIMLTVALLLALATMAALDAVRARVLVRCGVAFDARLAIRLMNALIDRGVAGGGVRQAQLLRDLDQFRQFLTGPALHAIFDLPWMPIYVGVLCLLHPVLGLVALAGAVLLLGLAMLNELATGRPLRRANDAAVRAYGFTDAALRNAEVIQAMGMQGSLLAGWERDRREMIGAQAIASERNATMTALIKFLRLFLQSLILGVGAWLAIDRAVTPGVIFAGSLLMGRALSPIEQVVGAWKSFVTARQSYRRVRALLDAEPVRGFGMQLPRPQGRLSVERLVFTPPGSDKPLLKGISFDLPAGQGLGLIGPSAAGKSTLARVVMGIWRPLSGTVRLDGANIADIDREGLAEHVGYLPQDVELFSGTVADNIARLGDPQECAEQIVEAAKAAGVHDLILRLPEGYETNIGVDGARLSGGQRQRVGLARALYGRPRLVVLDEPNSNLDAEGEEALMRAMQHLKEIGATLIVVTHRPSILANIDRMLVLREGRVEFGGTRQEVMAKLGGGMRAVVPARPQAAG